MAGRRIRSALTDLLFLAICLALVYGLYNYMFSSIPVVGSSMENTLRDGDKVLVYKTGKYRYGDIVVFNTHIQSADGERYFVKRIIALPGDEISINYDAQDETYYIWRNGERLDESGMDYASTLSEEMASMVVPEGKFFFLGDNRGESNDSRSGLMGRLDSIVGRVVARYVVDWDTFDVGFVRRR